MSIFRKHPFGALAPAGLLLVLLSGVGCDGDDDGDRILSSDEPPYDLTFSLDATFQAPHGGQPVGLAVVRAADGLIVAQGSGTISQTQNPTYSFTAVDVMEGGTSYEVHYWIDSNIGGGTPGVCDPKAIDHQWSVEFPTPTNDVAFTTSYQPGLTEDVCSTFP